MTKLRQWLPQILLGSGIAITVVFSFVAALSFQNPLMVAALLTIGIGGGAVVAGLGVIVESLAMIATHIQPARSDIRAQTEALLTVAQRLHDAD